MDDDAEVERTGRLIYMVPRTKKRTPAKLEPRRASMDETILLRVDAEQKAGIKEMAAREGLKVASFARMVLVKMLRGWKLVPPS